MLKELTKTLVKMGSVLYLLISCLPIYEFASSFITTGLILPTSFLDYGINLDNPTSTGSSGSDNPTEKAENKPIVFRNNLRVIFRRLTPLALFSDLKLFALYLILLIIFGVSVFSAVSTNIFRLKFRFRSIKIPKYLRNPSFFIFL